jgi:multisubunit Na+/H+ antiporter MnhB subunit
MHVIHIVRYGPADGDLTGALAAAAGVALIVLAAAIPWRHRGEGAATPRRRWANRALGTVGSLVLAFVVIFP